MKLPFIPKLFINEQPLHYLTKLAAANGYTSLHQMLSANELKIPSHKAQQLTAFTQIIQKLSGKTFVTSYSDNHLYDFHRYFQTLLSPHAKTCVICAYEDKNLIDNSFVYSNRCAEHKIKLHDHCPECLSPMEWDSASLKGSCGYCGIKLPVIDIAYCPIENYIKHHGIKNSLNFINDLCNATSFLLRPFDSNPEKIKGLSVIGSGDLFFNAYNLLSNIEIQNKWKNLLRDSRGTELKSLGSFSIEAPFYSLISQLKLNWAITDRSLNQQGLVSDILFKETEVIDFTIKPKWKTKEFSMSEQNKLAHFKCSTNLLPEVLGCSKKTISVLSEAKIILALNTRKACIHTFYDLRCINRVFSESVGLKLSKELYFLRLKDIRPFIKLHNISEELFISQFFLAKLKVRLTDNNGKFFECLRFNKYIVYRLVKKLYISSSKDKINHNITKSVFCISELDIRSLIVHRQIATLKWQQKTTYYRMSDFQKIEKKLFNLARYCTLHDLNFSQIFHSLSKVNINPIIGKSYFNSKVQVIRFIKHQKVIISKITEDNKLQVTRKTSMAIFLNLIQSANNTNPKN